MKQLALDLDPKGWALFKEKEHKGEIRIVDMHVSPAIQVHMISQARLTSHLYLN